MKRLSRIVCQKEKFYEFRSRTAKAIIFVMNIHLKNLKLETELFFATLLKRVSWETNLIPTALSLILPALSTKMEMCWD